MPQVPPEFSLKLWQIVGLSDDLAGFLSDLRKLLKPWRIDGELVISRWDPARRELSEIARTGPSTSRATPPNTIRLTTSMARELASWLEMGPRRAKVFRLVRASRRGHDTPSREENAERLEGEPSPALWLPLRNKTGESAVLWLNNGAAEPPPDHELGSLVAAAATVAWSLTQGHTLGHNGGGDRGEAWGTPEREPWSRKLGRPATPEVIIGEQTGLKQVMERVALVTRSAAPVLVLGETGTGKELIARALHQRGTRSAGPLLRVNCGAIPPELIDSQLFGHEKGAFTGADEARPGWFERADGGTLFLDEIGELPWEAQVRLLRVLQDGFIERVGGKRSLHVDVRIVAATHRDLAAMVQSKEFREDLWYRLAVFPIVLPPLRERREDIGALANYFAERAAAKFTQAVVYPCDRDRQLLLAYDWPGNIRELAAVIDRAAILGAGKHLAIEKALGGFGSASNGTSSPPSRSSTAPEPAVTLSGTSANVSDNMFPNAWMPLDEAMRQHILKTLERTGGRVEGKWGAAALLQINPNTLRARMRKLGIKK